MNSKKDIIISIIIVLIITVLSDFFCFFWYHLYNPKIFGLILAILMPLIFITLARKFHKISLTKNIVIIISCILLISFVLDMFLVIYRQNKINGVKKIYKNLENNYSSVNSINELLELAEVTPEEKAILIDSTNKDSNHIYFSLQNTLNPLFNNKQLSYNDWVELYEYRSTILSWLPEYIKIAGLDESGFQKKFKATEFGINDLEKKQISAEEILHSKEYFGTQLKINIDLANTYYENYFSNFIYVCIFALVYNITSPLIVLYFIRESNAY